MGVQTSYDLMRERLREDLDECLRQARELVVRDDVWGYEEMKEDYAMDVFQAVKKARDSV